MSDDSSQTTFTAENLRELQVSIPERITRLSERPSFASANPDDAEHVATWFALLTDIDGQLDAFEENA